MHVRVDSATTNGIGAALYQEDDNGKLVPKMFKSRVRTAGEKNYTPTDAELSGIHWAITKAFFPIVNMCEIVLYTDHMNLLHGMEPQDTDSATRRRWLYYLSRFNIIEVRHVPGVEFEVDHLSRANTGIAALDVVAAGDNAVQDYTVAEVKKAQSLDPFCRRIVGIVKKTAKQSKRADAHVATRCRMNENGLLEYRDILNQNRRGDTDNYIVVAPKAMVSDLVKNYHNAPAGHRCAAATQLEIRKQWWWPDMMKDIRNHKCTICEAAKAGNTALQQGTRSTYQPRSHSEAMAIDVYEIDDGGKQGTYKKALVCVYVFSRFPVVIPLKTRSSKEIAAKLIKVFADFGTPKILLSDKANDFLGEVTTLCVEHGIQPVATAPHSAWTNGAAERTNEILKKELRHHRLQKPDDEWESFLPLIHMKMRSTRNSSTHFSPYELLGMNQPEGSGTVILNQIDDDDELEDMTDEELKEWKTTMESKKQQALANDLEARDARLVAMNKKRKPKTYEVGDWAMIANPMATKTEQQTSEPMKIVKKSKNGQLYILKDHFGAYTSANIAMLRDSSATDYPKAIFKDKKKGPKAALVRKTMDGTGRYFIIDQQDIGDDKECKVYINKRQHSLWAQQKWVLGLGTISDYELVETFDMVYSSRNLLIPPTSLRRKHPNVYILQQGKAPSKKAKKKKAQGPTKS